MNRRQLFATVAVIVAVASFAAPAAAHAHLEAATPGSGTQLEEPPEELVLEFTESVQLATVEVIDGEGAEVGGEARIDPDDRTVVRASLTDLSNGVYTVRWEVLAEDGHSTSGGYVFAIGEEIPDRDRLVAAHEAGGLETSGLEAALSGTLLLGVVGLVGVPLTLLGVVNPVFGGGKPPAAVRRSRWLLAGSTVLFLAGAGLLGAVRLAESGGLSAAGMTSFLGGRVGVAWLAQLAVGIGLVALIHRSGSQPGGRTLAAIAGAGFVGALTVSATSHSSAIGGGVLLDLGHVLGASLWLGGLLTLGVVVPPALSERTDARSAASAVIRRFSVLAIAGLTVALMTGAFLAAWHLETVGAPQSLYETTLAIKVGLVAAALGAAGFLRTIVHRQLSSPSDGRQGSILDQLVGAERDPIGAFVRTIRAEAGILIAVILLSGLLAAAPTATHVAAEERYGPETATVEAEGYEFELRGVPAEVGPNAYDLSVTRNGEPVEGAETSLLFRSSTGGESLPVVELSEREPGQYAAVTVIPTARYWEVQITLRHDGNDVTETVRLHVYSAGGHVHDEAPSVIAWLQFLGVGIGVVGTAALWRELWMFRTRPPPRDRG